MKDIIIVVIEFLSIAVVLGSIFWGPWLFYIITGEPLNFGGGM